VLARLLLPVAVSAALALVVAGRAGAHLDVGELDERTRADVGARPDSPEAHLERARVLRAKGAFDEALEALDEAEDRGADRDATGGLRAAVFLDAGFPRMAKREVDGVLARRPGAKELLALRARAWLALGDREAAAADLGDAIARGAQPTPELVLERRDVLLALGRKADAVRALDDGMARIGRVVSLQLPAVDLEVELGRFDAALVRLDELARTSAAPNPFWVARRGEVLERAGRGAEARREYERALGLIVARGESRRAKPFDDLKQRLETALAPPTTGGDTK
jgi:tetratricopeptide (TPR) repeat protein